MFPSRFSYRSKAKTRRSSSSQHISWGAAFLFFSSVLSFYCVLFPEASGTWGAHVARFFGWLTGAGRYFLPLLVGYISALALFAKGKVPNVVKLFLLTGLFACFLVFLTLLGTSVWGENFGGMLGNAGQALFQRMFGVAGSWIVLSGITAALGVIFVGSTPGELLHRLTETLSQDWEEYRRVRSSKTKGASPTKAAPVVKPAAALTPNGSAAKAASPKIFNGGPTETPAKASTATAFPETAPVALPSGPAEIIRKTEKEAAAAAQSRAKKEAAPAAVAASPEAQKPSKPYTSPSLDIFDSAKKTAPVANEELTARARLLEQTLANFNIAARVVEIHPGPVITRYDLEPAPGVKVASISSRADDLALAMRSIGIRVLAPIPGKGAVGVEIPNSTPEFVGLKDLLARPEFYNHPSPLAFVLGKTVSGEPYIVDLAAMPHMLVAGATGAGKSVCIHAMISSILYRMPPDMVKFVMIDPKRLELPSYSGIPHLYDPRVSPIQAEVITQPKQSAKALVRLVKVMEYRYDLFAKANVRNIDSYNKKRKAAGLPPEYYLVVIIDELADLMLTSPKEVEDAVQRLAQMARAVGIHLVLATQRPSVDVITGVIKANLPARIALRVASAMDSRVIIDTVGADCLLGKGDMLFLPPASPDPVRVQGAYVSEKEVENLVAHVKQFGSPSYDDLFSSGSALEFAVEDKKEMKDLIEALKLVLERKRVSQDLLKAHFGSSARATNILSLLEVKEFIRKPEGSNRWDINFDAIEEFISKVNNIPDEEMMQ